MTEDIEYRLAEIVDALEQIAEIGMIMARIADAMEKEKAAAPSITLDDYS